MNDKEDSAWVFDSLIGFLQGPIWSAPLLTFIEERSLIFEPDTEDSKEYREVYQEYKNLVDLLLGCYMEDMGITPEQFELACSLNRHTKMPIHFQQSLFEQIWAANEYEIFKRMMIQKNLELQLQALNMIEQKTGLKPASLTADANDSPENELVMEELIRKQALESPEEEEDVDLETDPTLLEEEHNRLAAEYENEKVLLERALTENLSRELSSGSEARGEEEEEEDGEEEEEEEEEDQFPSKFNSSIASGPKRSIEMKQSVSQESISSSKSYRKDVSDEEMKRRQDYLKARRDKLVALKKQVRSQRLEMNSRKTTRPSSARAVAEASLKGDKDFEVPQQNIEPSILQIRKALAARLKAEVVRKENRH